MTVNPASKTPAQVWRCTACGASHSTPAGESVLAHLDKHTEKSRRCAARGATALRIDGQRKRRT